MTYALKQEATITECLRTTEMRTLSCITGNTLRDTIRNICEIQDVVQDGFLTESGDEHGETIQTGWMITGSQKVENQTLPRLPGRPPKRWCESWTSMGEQAR